MVLIDNFYEEIVEYSCMGTDQVLLQCKCASIGAFTLQQKLVRTYQKIGPDPIIFVKEQSSFHGAIGAYRRVCTTARIGPTHQKIGLNTIIFVRKQSIFFLRGHIWAPTAPVKS